MAKVIPVGPIDPVLYGFAKKQAEKAERDPRYTPKNCPAEMGRIIYRRIGGLVKALVFAVSSLIGMHRVNFVANYIPYKFTLRDERYDDIQTHSNVNEVYGDPVRVDGYGDWYSPTYDKVVSERSKGFTDLGQTASIINITNFNYEHHATYFATLYHTRGSYTISYTQTAETIVRIHEKYLDGAESCKAIAEIENDDPTPHYATNKSACLRDKLKVKVAHEHTVSTSTSGGMAGFSANDDGIGTGAGSEFVSSQNISDIHCGRKDEKFLVFYLRTDSQSSNGYSTGGPPYSTSTQTATYTLVVNGSASLSKTKEPDHHAALAVRIDGCGLAYLIYVKTSEQNDRVRVFSGLTNTSSAYEALSNKYGIFVAELDYKEKKRKRPNGDDYTKKLYYQKILWIRPKEKFGEDEDAIHLLDDDNSELIVITPQDPPNFGEKDGEDYPEGDEKSRDYRYMLFARTTDKNAVIAIDDDNMFDVTPMVKKYIGSRGGEDEMSIDDAQKWRGNKTSVGEKGQATMPHESGSGAGYRYMKPALMSPDAKNLIDALYFHPDNQTQQ